MSATKLPSSLEDRTQTGGRLYSPSSARNKGPIADAFAAMGFTSGEVLEIGSGSGEHAVELLNRFPDLSWIASDLSEESRVSCAAWAKYSGLEDRMQIRKIDLLARDSLADFKALDVLYSANVIHISPRGVLENMVSGAANILKSEGHLVLYGPFMRSGAHTSDSNAQFDKSLKSRNPEWGIRDLDLDVKPLAQENGLQIKAIQNMPANNLFIVIGRP